MTSQPSQGLTPVNNPPHDGLCVEIACGPRCRVVLWIVFVAFAAYYFGFSAFPMGHFKGDGTSLATGARQILEQGWEGPKIDYGRETRPGVIWMLLFVRWLTGADTYLAFSFLALIAGILNVVFVARFAARWAGLPAPLCAIGTLVLFPDSVVWGCYPQGTVLAGCLGMASLCLLARRGEISHGRLIAAGVLAGLAVLPRVDAVLLGLVSVPLLVAHDARKTLVRLGIFLGVALAVAGGGLYASGFDVRYVLHQTHTVLADAPPPIAAEAPPPVKSLLLRWADSETFVSCLAFFPLVTALLILVGTVRWCLERRWRELGMVAAGAGPILFVYWTQVRLSPLYYLTGLLACLAFAGLRYLVAPAGMGIVASPGLAADSSRTTPAADGDRSCRSGTAGGRGVRTGLVAVAAVFFLVQYPVGINIVVREKPWFRCPAAPLVRLWHKDLTTGPIAEVELDIGPGGAVANLERVRFCSGLLFHPLAYHATRAVILDCFAAMKDTIGSCESGGPLLIYTSEWASCSQVQMALQDLGYTCVERTAVGDAACRAIVSSGSAATARSFKSAHRRFLNRGSTLPCSAMHCNECRCSMSPVAVASGRRCSTAAASRKS